ncbi:MAG: hypothetical protein HYU37_00685 [Acidobacteria bacterium]|nr:hypothetical protein [Acidobacteriota bacterium]
MAAASVVDLAAHPSTNARGALSQVEGQQAQTLPPVPAGVVTTYRPAAKRVSPQDGFAAQQRLSELAKRPTPRDEFGRIDFSGNWVANFPSPLGQPGLRAKGTFEPDQAVMQRGAQWNKPLYKPEYWAKVRGLDFGKADIDPNYGCTHPAGVPRQNVPARIIQKNNQIWLLNGVENALRIVPLDDRRRDPLDAEYSTYNGMGLARWDGDTLVVESVGFNDITWLGWEGYFHSDKMTVTERFRRQGDLLFYDFTVDDPEVLMEPWTSITYVRRLNPNPVRQDEAPICDERDIDLLADPYNRG